MNEIIVYNIRSRYLNLQVDLTLVRTFSIKFQSESNLLTVTRSNLNLVNNHYPQTKCSLGLEGLNQQIYQHQQIHL